MLNVDVLVVGAGPAGSGAARVLACAGLRVLLTDRHAFPRDKVCGDALIPDSLAALATLGLRDRVDGAAYVSRVIRIYAPDGEYAELRGECAALPRSAFDELLVSGAIEAGAQFGYAIGIDIKADYVKLPCKRHRERESDIAKADNDDFHSPT